MIKNAKDKMVKGANDKQISARDSFIVEKAQKGFSPTEILVLLKREGFQAPARSRIYQILEANGVKAK